MSFISYINTHSQLHPDSNGESIVKTVDVLKSINFSSTAWNEVEDRTIVNWWRKVGLFESIDVPCTDHNYA